MLQVEKSAHRRFLLFIFIAFAPLMIWMLVGVTSRAMPDLFDGRRAEIRDEAELKQMTEAAHRLRLARIELARLGSKGDWQAAASSADTFIAQKDTNIVRAYRAEALLRAGQRDRALQDYAQLLTAGDPVQQADLLTLRGDRNGYRRVCAEALSSYGRPIDGAQPDANNTAWVTAIAPEGAPDYEEPIRLAASAVIGADAEHLPTYLNTLGAVLYRAGDYDGAIARLNDSEALQPEPYNWPFLAMAHERAGHHEEARKWLERLRRRIDATYATRELQMNRWELILFWQEAEATLAGKTSGN